MNDLYLGLVGLILVVVVMLLVHVIGSLVGVL